MTKDDPFGLDNDAGRTRIRPVSANRQAPGTFQNRDLGQAPEVAARMRQARAHGNPLVAAFSVLLGLAPELERARAPENPETLRARLLDNLTYARDNAVGAGVPLKRADQGAWFVAALLDDIALNTPWGGHSSWPRQSLVATMYGEVDAGERFFERFDGLMRYPDRDPELLELAFLCLSMGFRGRYRLQGAAGEGAIATMRAQAARVLPRSDADADLSPHWQGVEATDEPPRFAVPLWSIAVVATGILTAVYVALGMSLSSRGEALYALATSLPPAERAQVFRPVRETVDPPPPLVIEPVVVELLPLVTAAAPAESAAALSGRESVSLATVVIQSTDPEVFRSARAELNDGYDPLIRSIAAVIVQNIEIVGGVTVLGHTDSVPVQRTNPFQSNQGLSEARAKTVADLLVAAGVPVELVQFEGRAANEPVGDNATREGRAKNRRVEIVIQKRV
jgi:type VI secretion system protein ImpK